mgnify:CR=1 FL=1
MHSYALYRSGSVDSYRMDQTLYEKKKEKLYETEKICLSAAFRRDGALYGGSNCLLLEPVFVIRGCWMCEGFCCPARRKNADNPSLVFSFLSIETLQKVCYSLITAVGQCRFLKNAFLCTLPVYKCRPDSVILGSNCLLGSNSTVPAASGGDSSAPAAAAPAGAGASSLKGQNVRVVIGCTSTSGDAEVGGCARLNIERNGLIRVVDQVLGDLAQPPVTFRLRWASTARSTRLETRPRLTRLPTPRAKRSYPGCRSGTG